MMLSQKEIENRIFTLQGVQVMIDRDLEEIYGVETKVLNQAVKRNIERFPDLFRFQLTGYEKNELVTNCDQFDKLKHSLKDLGKKWFAFSKMDSLTKEILNKLEK